MQTTTKKMRTFCLQFVILFLSLIKRLVGEQGKFFKKEQCNNFCQVATFDILSENTFSVIHCAALSQIQGCQTFVYIQDTGMCACDYIDHSSKAVKEKVDNDGATQCYNEIRPITCNDVRYKWIPDLETCVRVFTTKENFQTAITKCSEDDAHLVMPSTGARTLALNIFLQCNEYLSQYWIGANDISVEGQYMWANGLPVTYTNWLQNEPSELSGEDCVRIVHKKSYQYYWKDINCSKKYGYICAKNTNALINSG